MSKKKHIPDTSANEPDDFEQPPMGGSPDAALSVLPEYQKEKYADDIRILQMRALQGTGMGAKKYNGYLIDEEGNRSYMCEYHQVNRDGRMVSIQALARDAHGSLTQPQAPHQIRAFKYTFTEPHVVFDEETGETFREPILILNTSKSQKALKFRREIYDEADAYGFSLRETAPKMIEAYEGIMSDEYPDRPFIELHYEES